MVLAISSSRLRGGAPSPASKALICNSFHPDYDASSFCISTPCLLHRLFIQRRVDIISALLSPGFLSSVMEYPIIALCMKAISDPSSISRAERDLINCRPPPRDEDDLCIAQCGLNMKSLASKAISYSSFPLSNSPLSNSPLSEIEATILHSVVDCLTLKDRITYFTTKSNFSNYLT